ncbi:hypothetical protein PFISCL1PPCAC_28627, partial [Pristionchus fissidentatus]
HSLICFSHSLLNLLIQFSTHSSHFSSSRAVGRQSFSDYHNMAKPTTTHFYRTQKQLIEMCYEYDPTEWILRRPEMVDSLEELTV